ALAADRRVRARSAARAGRRRGGIRLRRGAARRDQSRRVRRCRRRGGALRPRPRDGRAGRRLARGVRRGLRSLPAALPGPATLGGIVEPVRWGILSTARINRLLLAGARATDAAEVVAVASRGHERAAEYAA